MGGLGVLGGLFARSELFVSRLLLVPGTLLPARLGRARFGVVLGTLGTGFELETSERLIKKTWK